MLMVNWIKRQIDYYFNNPHWLFYRIFWIWWLIEGENVWNPFHLGMWFMFMMVNICYDKLKEIKPNE